MPVLIRFNGHYLINEFGITADHSEELITISIDECCYKENNQVFTLTTRLKQRSESRRFSRPLFVEGACRVPPHPDTMPPPINLTPVTPANCFLHFCLFIT